MKCGVPAQARIRPSGRHISIESVVANVTANGASTKTANATSKAHHTSRGIPSQPRCTRFSCAPATLSAAFMVRLVGDFAVHAETVDARIALRAQFLRRQFLEIVEMPDQRGLDAVG